MGNSDILSLAFLLREKLINSNLYSDLKEKEKIMLEDEKCFELLNEYQRVQDEYKDAKRFEKYGSNVDQVQKKLSEIKYKVDENTLVKDYSLAYKKMNKKLKEIEKIIFNGIIKEKREILLEE